MSVIQSDCKHPERCVIGRSTLRVISLVEVADGARTSTEATRAGDIVLDFDKKKDQPSPDGVVRHLINNSKERAPTRLA